MVATPHHLPALPTAAPVAVDIDPGTLVSGVADQRLIRRIRRVTATGERLVQVVVPPGFGGRRVALTAALDIGGHVLVLTGRARGRSAWRRAFQHVRTLADAPDAKPGTGSPATLTCITVSQLSDLLVADVASPAIAEPPLTGLGVLVLDLRRVRARDWEAIEHVLTHNATHAPVVLALGGVRRGPLIAGRATSGARRGSGSPADSGSPTDPGPRVERGGEPAPGAPVSWTVRAAPPVPRLDGRPVSALRTHRVFVEPALLVRSRRLFEYQELQWLVPLTGEATAAARARFRTARRIVDGLVSDAGSERHGVRAVPGLRRFVESNLPHTERGRGSTRSAYIRALARSPRWYGSLIRVHRGLGGEVPASTATMLRAVDELRRPVRATDFCLVLARYRTALASIDHEQAAARCRQIDDATARFGFTTVGSRIVPDPTLDAHPLHRPSLRRLVRWERERDASGATIVLADPGGPDDARALARAARIHDDDACSALGALHGDELLVPDTVVPAVHGLVASLLAEFGLGAHVEHDADGWARIGVGAAEDDPDAHSARRDLALMREAAATSLEQGALRVLVCAPDAIGALAAARPELRRSIAAVIDARAAADDAPLPLLAAPLIERRRSEPRGDRVVNLWRVLAVGPGEISRRNLARRVRTCELTASLFGDGRAQYGCSGLRELLDTSITDEARAGIPEQARRSFNRRSLRVAQRARLVRDRWRSLTGVHEHLAVEVEIDAGRSSHRPGFELAAIGSGAQMSERRARARFERFVTGRRGLWLQALVAITVATLILPTIAGPILGSLVAAGCVGMVAMRTERRVASLRRRTLHRPASCATVVRDVACVVLRTMRSCEGIPQDELPTRLIRCVSAGDHRMQVWLDSEDERLVQQFSRTLAEALGPISDQRYIVGRPQTRVPTTRRELRDAFQLHVTTYHPVPTLFGSRRERAELYAGHWTQVFGPGRLRYTAGGKGRLLRFAHYGQDHLRVRARTVTTLR